MTTQNLGLFKGMNSKMHFLNHRQRLISQNIANADTPGYRPQDLKKVRFEDVLDKSYEANPNMKRVSIDTTNTGHMAAPDSAARPQRPGEQRRTYEVAPSGNAVIMEEQLFNATNNMMDYNLMTSLYQKHIGMIKTSIGTGQ